MLDFYGPDAEAEMRKTLIKYQAIPDRTEGIQAALAKAKANGGGVVYFPPGRYGLRGVLDIPPRTVLKGAATGLSVLWWGVGRFNLDGGGSEGLARDGTPSKPPDNLIFGREFGIEDMSLYLPLEHQTAIAAGDRFRMHRVRIRIDHHWALDGNQRPEGTLVRLGKNFEVTDCDLVAKGTGLIPGQFGLIARNRIVAGKTNCPLGGSREVIVEDNQFVSTFPTAYMNIAGVGRNLYFARNCQEALSTQQADYSFTFDAGCAAFSVIWPRPRERGSRWPATRSIRSGHPNRAISGRKPSSSSRTAAARASGVTWFPIGDGSGIWSPLSLVNRTTRRSSPSCP